MSKYLYEYNGSIYLEGHEWMRDYVRRTWASSIAQAARNIEHHIAEAANEGEHGLLRVSRNPHNYMIMDISEDLYPDIREHDQCDKCGALLSDQGDCPVCDYGEEDL